MNDNQHHFLLSELGHLRHLVETTQSPSARISLESRLSEVENQLGALEPENTGLSAQIMFSGTPVVKSLGIEASFATQATLDYIDTVYLVGLDGEGLLKSTGRIPDSPDRYKLLITGVARGSFGFRLENAIREPSANDAVAKAIKRAHEILDATQTEEGLARQLLTETPPRIVRPMHSFAKRIADANATCYVSRGTDRFSIQRPRLAEAFLRPFNPDNKVRSPKPRVTQGQPVKFIGRFQGYLSLSREVQIELLEPWTEQDALLMRPLTRMSYKGHLDSSVRLDIENILGDLVLIEALILRPGRNPRFRIVAVDTRARELRNQYPFRLPLPT